MKLTCLNCMHGFEGTVSWDELGWHSMCPKCGCSFDVDVKYKGDLIMNRMRVWWIPQVGASNEAFYIPVQSVEEGKKVMDILSAYDAYQLQNRIKSDYCNAGGLEIYNPETEDYEDWYFETEDDYFDNVDEYLSTTDKAEEIDRFTNELFEQIDWEKIEQMTN